MTDQPLPEDLESSEDSLIEDSLGEDIPAEDLPADHRSGFVAVIGRPNVGKSTLINRLLGQKIAIVSPRPQTTRVRQLGILTEEHAQIVFVDTPGLHKPRHQLGEFMVQVAQQALQDADLILFVVEANFMPGPGDQLIAGQIAESAPGVPVLLVINKVDLTPPDQLQIHVDAYLHLVKPADWIALSAAKGTGIDDLKARLISRLPLGPRYFPPDQVTETYVRQIAAEMIREKVLLNTREEIPHAVAVEITDFKERSEDLTYVGATIYVERDSQKSIVIGKGGALLKKIGGTARREIEDLIGTRVYLELWVKVLPNWREDETILQRLGYRIR